MLGVVLILCLFAAFWFFIGIMIGRGVFCL
jgi:hypothetical protein